MVGEERDFNGLKARWVMWLDVPEEMRKHESVAYKEISGKRDTQLGINAGSPAFILDDPTGNSWLMKSASLIVDPDQTYESLSDLGGRLDPAPGWMFRTEILKGALVLTPTTATSRSPRTTSATPTTGSAAPYSNYKP